MIGNLLTNPSFLLCVFASTVVRFILTTIEYWAPNYMKYALHGDHSIVDITFPATVATAPVIGALAGGLLAIKFAGSYSDRRALTFCFIAYTIFMLFCLSAAFVDNYLTYQVLLWFVALSSASYQAVMIGIILSSVSPQERTTASSFSILIQMCIGLMPAPYIYGLLIDEYPVTEGNNNASRVGMKVTLLASLVGFVFLTLAMLARKKDIVSNN